VAEVAVEVAGAVVEVDSVEAAVVGPVVLLAELVEQV
jgi:hypothetical protein